LIDREVLLSGDVVSLPHSTGTESDDQICTTLLSAASRKLQQIDYPMVFIDEASMATEPLTIIPLMKGVSCLSGDPDNG
jgi:superfamily I DNA and/or RNA helicase